ncbi:MAG: hypothetical protein HXY20_08005 [Acidobacteria bacterium]|nr:hypothetical protein [Acidobacteriota bacterium]
MNGKRAKLLRRENAPAYLTVMATWACISAASAALLKEILAPALAWPAALSWALVTVMAGMAIMFFASALNLRKMRRGFERLARGEQDPQIPPVWCPVLTMATEAAVELQRSLQEQETGKGN